VFESPVQEILTIGRSLRNGFCCEARLYALLVPTSPSLAAKVEAARRCFDAMNRAKEADEFFRTSFSGSMKDRLMEWPPAIFNSLPESDDRLGIEKLLTPVVGSCGHLLARLRGLSEKHFVLDHMHRWAGRMSNNVPVSDAPLDFHVQPKPSLPHDSREEPRKVLEGPQDQVLDKRYRRDVSARTFQAFFIDDPHQVIRYFWFLSSLECGASDIASLNLAEYDLMPFEFYWDSAKQVYDEARHAQTYFDLSISLFHRVSSSLPKKSETFQIMKNFLKSGIGLPINAEGNHYPLVHSASLVERLVLMNIMTETPAVGRHRENLRSNLAATYPEVATVIETDLYDEMFHAILGKKWLEYLFPDSVQREDAIKDAALLRGFLFTLSLAEAAQKDPVELLNEAISSKQRSRANRYTSSKSKRHLPV
jgi:hypothetical protein